MKKNPLAVSFHHLLICTTVHNHHNDAKEKEEQKKKKNIKHSNFFTSTKPAPRSVFPSLAPSSAHAPSLQHSFQSSSSSQIVFINSLHLNSTSLLHLPFPSHPSFCPPPLPIPFYPLCFRVPHVYLPTCV